MTTRPISGRVARAFATLILPLALGACAGATVGSGVAESTMREAPYYAGRLLPVDSQAVAVMPIGYQRGAAQSPIFEPEGDEGSALAALLDDMNAFLADSIELGPLVDVDALTGTAPDVMFRCVADPFEECDDFDDGMEPQMRLAIARPSDEWRTAFGAALAEAGAGHALMITLEFSDYWTYQRNLLGSKEVRLGTDNSLDLPWITSLETPVSVLQVTGAILDRDGRAVRIGAEGMLARRTGILISAIGGQVLISDEDVAELRQLRRDDLPGQPLAWKVALRNLVAGLTGSR